MALHGTAAPHSGGNNVVAHYPQDLDSCKSPRTCLQCAFVAWVGFGGGRPTSLAKVDAHKCPEEPGIDTEE
eukprot:6490389-Pyramimonas_sp.AAC.1